MGLRLLKIVKAFDLREEVEKGFFERGEGLHNNTCGKA